MKKLLTDKEVSMYTGISLWSINEARRKGTIPFIQIPGIRRFYFSKESIDKWLEKLQQLDIDKTISLKR